MHRRCHRLAVASRLQHRCLACKPFALSSIALRYDAYDGSGDCREPPSPRCTAWLRALRHRATRGGEGAASPGQSWSLASHKARQGGTKHTIRSSCKTQKGRLTLDELELELPRVEAIPEGPATACSAQHAPCRLPLPTAAWPRSGQHAPGCKRACTPRTRCIQCCTLVQASGGMHAYIQARKTGMVCPKTALAHPSSCSCGRGRSACRAAPPARPC